MRRENNTKMRTAQYPDVVCQFPSLTCLEGGVHAPSIFSLGSAFTISRSLPMSLISQFSLFHPGTSAESGEWKGIYLRVKCPIQINIVTAVCMGVRPQTSLCVHQLENLSTILVTRSRHSPSPPPSVSTTRSNLCLKDQLPQ